MDTLTAEIAVIPPATNDVVVAVFPRRSRLRPSMGVREAQMGKAFDSVLLAGERPTLDQRHTTGLSIAASVVGTIAAILFVAGCVMPIW